MVILFSNFGKEKQVHGSNFQLLTCVPLILILIYFGDKAKIGIIHKWDIAKFGY